MERYDIVIVGAGPAGLTAALYAARAGRRALVLEGAGFGGQIVAAPRIENYPGLPRCSGTELADRLVEQVLELGVEVELAQANSLTPTQEGFRLDTSDGAFLGSAVILATGVTHKGLGLEGEEALVGHGVSYCAVCDGAFYRGRRVAVVGGGNTALQDALFLSSVADRVFLIHRREEFRGERRLAEELARRENVEFLLNHVPKGLTAHNGQLRGLQLENRATGQSVPLAVEGLFLAVGRQPVNGAFAGLVALDEQGYLAAGEDCSTNVPGVFAAGDCRRKAVRQLTTAVGDGAAAAVAACEFLDRAGRK